MYVYVISHTSIWKQRHIHGHPQGSVFSYKSKGMRHGVNVWLHGMFPSSHPSLKSCKQPKQDETLGSPCWTSLKGDLLDHMQGSSADVTQMGPDSGWHRWPWSLSVVWWIISRSYAKRTEVYPDSRRIEKREVTGQRNTWRLRCGQAHMGRKHRGKWKLSQ